MRKLLLIFGIALLALMSVVPAFAQDATPEPTEEVTAEPTAEADATEAVEAETETDAEGGTIVDIAAADPQFSTLVAAVEAAGLTETLADTSSNFTVFAPTDDAFAAAVEALGLTADELLADTGILTEILTYHVVAQSLPSDEIVSLLDDDGFATISTVNGADITVQVTEDGIFLNPNLLIEDASGIEVITTDIQASNGVIHVIDGVLLPPAEEAETSTAFIRIAHLSPDAPAVDIYINGELSDIARISYPNITGWVEVPVGTYQIAIVPADSPIEDAVINAELTFAEGTWTTIAAVGSAVEDTITAQLITEDYSLPIPEDQARVTVFHAIADAPPVDVLADGDVLISELAFPAGDGNDGAFTLDVPADTYDLQVVPSGATEPVLLDLPETTLAGGNAYFIAAIGYLGEPDVVISEVTAEQLTSLIPAAEATEEAAATEEADATEEAASDETAADETTGGSITDVATGAGSFTTLLAALDAAGLTETLATGGPYTVFAPTDDAFAALGQDTLDSLLADPEALADILTYHVVEGEVLAADVVASETLQTLNGGTITVSVDGDTVTLNGVATVIQTDITASNGVIHVIDAVLLPETE